MSIVTTIKRLRRDRNITQAHLRYLNNSESIFATIKGNHKYITVKERLLCL